MSPDFEDDAESLANSRRTRRDREDQSPHQRSAKSRRPVGKGKKIPTGGMHHRRQKRFGW